MPTIACASLGALACAATAAAQGIEPAPAFDAKDLTAPPREHWITNGGNVYNQRYSPLTGLNRDNVAMLKAKWRTGMGSGASRKNSGQVQLLAYDGTIYAVNGDGDAFAIDVDTGKILWTYHGRPDPTSGNPLGWTSRGLALGDGKVFMAQVDAKLTALDQKTGEPVWSVPAERWQDGFSITSAPLYYDGMVITGFSGGELGIRGRVKAFDARDGKLLWTFYTIPAPGEIGHETWPQDSDAWQHGGAPVWQTPAVDPELGLLYFSTGNPGPDLHGGVRAGDNLFSSSIVAIDVHTGEYRWHFQQVHHDLWDYDSPNPVVLFDAEYGGRLRKGLVEVSKTGWAYILDRETGKPLIGIDERPVPQEPRQATAATQPYPRGDAIVPHEIDIAPEGVDLVNGGRIFTPFWTEPVAVKPGTMGGANWPPSAYDPETHLLYVCASDRINTFRASDDLPDPGPNQVYMGGRFTQAEAQDRGILAALDVTTNRLVWRQQWPEICYSGAVVTAGGLLFVGRSDGRLTALDKSNGHKLWEFMTDAGVNTTVTTFEHEGQQLVAVHAGGATFANSKRGDGIWLFSLDGTIESLAPGGRPGAGPSGRAPSAGAAAPAEAGVAAAPDLAHGERLYLDACQACHGADGGGGQGGGPSLRDGLTPDVIVGVAAEGRNNMPAFGGDFSDTDLRDVAASIVQKLAAK
ncbi:MAG TPA: PQQ-binding-like beta-propeller repeat protein [Gammaproteobacteria bacterium]|nr:PQQ-binding-like beta-propeller repeat protein [Gammaproteobacteria bacterium]